LSYEILEEHLKPAELANLALITGGARSGKSAFAEKIVGDTSGHVVYIATMRAGGTDGESVARIDKHKSRRPQQWQTVEEPYELARQIEALKSNVSICLIDCLSLWLANSLPHIEESILPHAMREIEKSIESRTNELLQAIADQPEINFVIVTNEVGSGIVPVNVVARLYRDLLGTLNQQVARSAKRAWLCCVGIQIVLKA
jgi:adenosylcobinamide kinase/adenosylcobinamide-phosphate guanylyltransferase